jgi:hypothetical protein
MQNRFEEVIPQKLLLSCCFRAFRGSFFGNRDKPASLPGEKAPSTNGGVPPQRRHATGFFELQAREALR